MKKLLALLGVMSLSVAGTSAVVACGPAESVDEYKINSDAQSSLKDVIKEVIAEGDIKGEVRSDLTYNQFFNIDDSNDSNFLQTYLYNKVSAKLAAMTVETGEGEDKQTEPKYTEEEIKTQMAEVLKWSQKAVHLVYIDAKADEAQAADQEIVEVISRDGNADKTLERILLDQVKKHYELDKDPDGEWWADAAHSRVSLGISFDKKAGNIDLEAADQFWTFTFATE